MEIVEGQTNRHSLQVELIEGKLKVYHISEAKLRLFRDGGTIVGRMNDWAYTFLTCSISFFIACLTTNSFFLRYLLALFAILTIGLSVVLFVVRKNRKNYLQLLYDEVVSGDI